MVFTIAEIQKVLVLSEHMAHALWVMELRLVIGSIDEANLSISNLVLELHRILIDHH